MEGDNKLRGISIFQNDGVEISSPSPIAVYIIVAYAFVLNCALIIECGYLRL